MIKPTVLSSTIALSLLGAALIGCDASNPTSVSTTEQDYIKRGQYIAATAECLACHTPLTDKGPDMTRLFEGGNAWLTPALGIGVSPNLTPYADSDIKELSVDQLADKWLATKDGQFLPPMPGLGKYTREDLKALAYYFKSLPAKENKAPKTFLFAGKTGDDKKKWPYPAYPEFVKGDAFGDKVLGAYEIVNSPLTDGKLDQAMIEANIGAANAAAQ